MNKFYKVMNKREYDTLCRRYGDLKLGTSSYNKILVRVVTDSPEDSGFYDGLNPKWYRERYGDIEILQVPMFTEYYKRLL